MKTRVLIVDDEPDILTVVKKRFQAQNFEVLSAVNGRDGINKTLQFKPDVIIMDVIMPTMSGADAVRGLRAMAETKDIPVLFLSAIVSYSEKSNDEQKIEIDGESFSAVAKPFDAKELIMEVQKLLRKKNDSVSALSG